MKANQTSRIMGNLLLAAVMSITALFSFIPVSGQAQENHAMVELKHVGNSGENMFFRLQINNGGADRLVISVRDRGGESLYWENSSEKKYLKTFQVPREMGGDIYFQIWNAKERKFQRYEVRTTTRSFEETIVSRVD